MRTVWIAVGSVALAAVLVVGLVAVGATVFGRELGMGPVQAQGPQTPQSNWGWGMMGMMGGYPAQQDPDGTYSVPCTNAYSSPAVGTPLTIDQARQAAEQYIAGLNDPNLKLGEVMEFERNVYAIVVEKSTGIGAMELLIDRSTGAVGPEFGPNMMWNNKYGMMRNGGMMGGTGMMGGYVPRQSTGAANTVTSQQAREYAQKWLDQYRPGTVAEDQPDAFYGYYTIHTLKDGAITGMLSVQGTSGQVWFHNWHGDFTQMIGVE